MTKKTKQYIAELNEAKKHWERLKACNTIEDFEKEGYNSDHCILCQNRINDYNHVDCELPNNPCPIAIHTGQHECRMTPYHDAFRAIKGFIFRIITDYNLERKELSNKDFQQEKKLHRENKLHSVKILIQKEIDFIQEVIDENIIQDEFNFMQEVIDKKCIEIEEMIDEKPNE